MAINYLQYSPLYQQTTTAPVKERRAVVASHLDEYYRTPGKGLETIGLIQNKMGTRRGLGEHGFYKDFRLFRTLYKQYLTADEEQKAKIVAEAEADHNRDHGEKERDPILHAVWCLWHDDIRTMDDVLRLHAQDIQTDPQPLPESEAPTETGEESLTLSTNDLLEITTQEGNGRIAAINMLLIPVKNLFGELIRENIAFRDEIAKLGRERAFLNRLLSEYRARLNGVVVMDEKLLAGAEEIARELDNTAWAQTNRLPLHTNPEKWHNQSMEIVYGPVMRENFESKHWAKERKQVRDHLHRYAEEGRGHNSFYSKVFDTEKGDQRRPGVPEHTKRYWWNRVSDGVRFYTEIKGGKLFVYNIEPKENMS